MVQYIGVQDLSAMLNRIGPGPFLQKLADQIRSDFLRWHDFEKSARLASHSPDGVIELMPISDGEFYAFKFVNGHPKNTNNGQLTVTAFGVLADVGTGYPVLLSELTLTTALRTAATSALAAAVMARPNSRTMAMIGAGAQSEFQVLAFHHLVGISEVRVFDIDPEASAKLLRNLAGTTGLTITIAASTHEAVHGADIITTATADKTRATIITPDMVAPGVHLNAIGGDCPGKTELHRDIVEHAHVVVEYTPQTRIEGEIQQMPADFPVVELWEVLAGKAQGRRSAQDVTLFDSVGFALEDYSALRLLRDLANTGTAAARIDLLPAPADPKDLFGQLSQVPAPRLRSVA